MIIKPFTQTFQEDVISLWRECDLVRPWNDPRHDIERKLSVGADLFLVGTLHERLIATLMGGYEGHRGWINYLAVSPAHRGRGHARRLVGHLEALLIERGCPKLNLQVRDSNTDMVDFYRHLHYQHDQSICLGKRLIPDLPDE